MPEDTELLPEASPRRKGQAVPILIVALLMGAEGVGVYIAAKVVGSDPASAMADGGDAGSVDVGGSGEAYTEVELADPRETSRLIRNVCESWGATVARESGVLTIKARGTAMVAVREGQVLRVAVEDVDGAPEGIPLVAELLRWTEGSFSFDADAMDAVEDDFGCTTSHLLMQAAQHVDESERDD